MVPPLLSTHLQRHSPPDSLCNTSGPGTGGRPICTYAHKHRNKQDIHENMIDSVYFIFNGFELLNPDLSNLLQF